MRPRNDAQCVDTRTERQRPKIFATIAILGAALLAGGLIATIATPAAATGHPTTHKSYVCKYVGTPGVDERLQTGQNPIWVSNKSLLGHDGTVQVGQEFSDAHGKSVVIVANTPKLHPEPGIDQCPAPVTPTPPPTTEPPTPPEYVTPGNAALVCIDGVSTATVNGLSVGQGLTMPDGTSYQTDGAGDRGYQTDIDAQFIYFYTPEGKEFDPALWPVNNSPSIGIGWFNDGHGLTWSHEVLDCSEPTPTPTPTDTPTVTPTPTPTPSETPTVAPTPTPTQSAAPIVPSKPVKTTTVAAPKTGDDMSPIGWIITLGVTASAASALLVPASRRRLVQLFHS